MLTKKNIIFIIFSSLFYLSACQVHFRSIETLRLRSFAKCVENIIEKSNINDIPLDLVLSLLNNPQNADYKKFKETMTKNFDIIKECLIKSNVPKLPDGTSVVDLNNIFKEKYDWKKIIECLVEKVKNIDTSPFKKLIDYINEEKYLEALREEFKLRNNGNSILKECTPAKI